MQPYRNFGALHASDDKHHGDADFIFQQDFVPVHNGKGTNSWSNALVVLSLVESFFFPQKCGLLSRNCPVISSASILFSNDWFPPNSAPNGESLKHSLRYMHPSFSLYNHKTSIIPSSCYYQETAIKLVGA